MWPRADVGLRRPIPELAVPRFPARRAAQPAADAVELPVAGLNAASPRKPAPIPATESRNPERSTGSGAGARTGSAAATGAGDEGAGASASLGPAGTGPAPKIKGSGFISGSTVTGDDATGLAPDERGICGRCATPPVESGALADDIRWAAN